MSVADGVVIYAKLVIKSNGQPSTWGRLAVVRHTMPDGSIVHSRYGHLRILNVSVGDTVARGQQLGTIGGTEYGVPDHLHFDISTSGILETNPTYWPGDNLPAAQQHFVDPKKWIMEHRPDLPPPALPGIDMPPYFLPAVGNFGDICILKNNWGQGDERQQLQRQGNLSFVTKNQLWERRRIAADGIYLELDTSPNESEYYTIDGSPWLPLKWSPGDEHFRAENVKVFRKSDCILVNQYSTSNKIRFFKLHTSWASAGNITLSNVIELQWIINNQVEETYWFAPGKGLVSWSNLAGKKSWVTEVVPAGQQGNNVRESGCFG